MAPAVLGIISSRKSLCISCVSRFFIRDILYDSTTDDGESACMLTPRPKLIKSHINIYLLIFQEGRHGHMSLLGLWSLSCSINNAIMPWPYCQASCSRFSSSIVENQSRLSVLVASGDLVCRLGLSIHNYPNE